MFDYFLYKQKVPLRYFYYFMDIGVACRLYTTGQWFPAADVLVASHDVSSKIVKADEKVYEDTGQVLGRVSEIV